MSDIMTSAIYNESFKNKNKTKQTLETILHKQCFKILMQLENIPENQKTQNEFFAYHSPNGSKRNIEHLQFLKSLGLRAGVPDIIIYRHYTKPNIYCEFKSPIGYLSKEQRIFKEKLQRMGHKFYVIKTIDEFYSMLRQEKLI
jgi:hypothetical protein